MQKYLDPANPVFQSGIAPFLAALLLIGVLYGLSGRRAQGSFATFGAAAALALAYYLIQGLPFYPPRASSHKIGYLLYGSAALAFFLAFFPARRIASFAVMLAALVMGLLWLASSKLGRGDVLEPGLVLLAGLYLLWRFESMAGPKLAPAVALTAFAFALAAVTMLGNSASIAQGAGAAGAAGAAYLLWNWPRQRMAFAPVAIAGLALPLLFFAGQAALYSRSDPWALGALLLIPLCDLPFTRLGKSGSEGFLPPLLFALACAIPFALAIYLAWRSSSGLAF
jgi:hypothetical protein